MIETVIIQPTSKRARERVKAHGQKMTLEIVGSFRGTPAILVQSLEQTWSCQGQKMHWGGWFDENEIDLASTLATKEQHNDCNIP